MMEPEVCARVPQLVAMRNECFSTEVCISLCTRAPRARFMQCLSAVARHALLSLQGGEGTRMPRARSADGRSEPSTFRWSNQR